MKLADILTEGRVHLDASASDLCAAATVVLKGLLPETGVTPVQIEQLAADLASGVLGSVIRANDDVLLAALEHPLAEGTVASLGVFPAGFSAPGGREGDGARAKVMLLLLTSARVHALRAEAFPRLARVFRSQNTTQAVLAATSPQAILGADHLVQTDLQGALLVADAMSPISFRIYPDTPLPEVIDLVVRRGVRSLPVVGSDYQVLGLISQSDALGQMVQRHGAEEEESEPVLARDIMSRSVLCVEGDQTLLEAARLMVNKHFERLPVVRDGELVGFVTEETALRMLSNALHEENLKEEET